VCRCRAFCRRLPPTPSTIPITPKHGHGTLTITNNGTGVAESVSAGDINLASGAIEFGGTKVLAYPLANTDTSSLAIGAGALASETTIGLDNVAIGYQAGQNVTNNQNTAIGYQAMLGTTTNPMAEPNRGSTAVGYQAAYSAQGLVTDLTAVGAQAAYNVTTAGHDSAFGALAMFSSTTSPLTGSSNTALGDSSLYSIQGTAASDTAAGASSGQYISTGSSNTAIGYDSMLGVTTTPITGSSNTAVGASSLSSLQGAATKNSVLGYQAGNAITTGTDNTLLGYTAGSLVTGNSNIILGEAGNITSGGSNILIGNSLGNTTATSSNQLDIGDIITGTTGTTGNIGIGIATPSSSATLDVEGTKAYSGYFNNTATTAAYGVYSASASTTTGAAVVGTITGAANTGYAGYFANTATSGTNYAIYASNGAANGYAVYASNTNSSGVALWCSSSYGNGGCGGSEAWTNSSDLRLKDRIQNLPDDRGLNSVLKLRPVTYRWKDKARDQSQHIGLIAQEVEPLYPEVVSAGPDGMKSMAYSDLVVPLIKAAQQQQDEIEMQDDELAELRKEIAALKARH